jgi:hypothetical protein
MAKILEFRVSPDKATQAVKRRRPRTAEIVIFPGVRYERWDECGSTSGRPTKGIARDTLKLVE